MPTTSPTAPTRLAVEPCSGVPYRLATDGHWYRLDIPWNAPAASPVVVAALIPHHPDTTTGGTMATTTREQHIVEVRERALAELDGTERGRANALSSVASDLGKHPDTVGHGAVLLGTMLAMNGHMATDEQVRVHIDGIQ